MSEQAKLPEGVEEFPVRICECGAIHDRPELGCPECGSVIARAAGEAIYISDLPAVLAQRDKEWREALLGDEARQAAVVELKRATGLDLPPVVLANGCRQILQAAIEKAAPNGGGES